MAKSPRQVVYTAVMGGYEALREQPIAASSTVDFLCFTDDPSLVSDSWDVRLVEPAFPYDLVRSARTIKIAGHSLLKDYDESIWVDNRVQLERDPAEILAETLDGVDVFVFLHSFRDLLVDEFDAVVRGGYDDATRVYEQLLHYAEGMPGVLDERAIWTGFLPRRRTARVNGAMRLWMDHVLRYSRRDQLSVNAALRDPKLPITRAEGDNRLSSWHSWATLDAETKRTRSESGSTNFERSIRAPLSRLRQIEAPRDDLLRAYRESAETRDAKLVWLRGQVELAKKRADAEHAEAERLRDTLRELQSTQSYRAARAVSRLKGAVTRRGR